MKIRFKKLDPNVEAPKYFYENDVAFDIKNNDPDYMLKPGENKMFGTGLTLEVPPGYVQNIRDRSGLAAKHAIHTMAGIIDPGYRGELKVVLINLGKEAFNVEKGMRIAQMLIHKVEHVEFEEATELTDNTHRGDGGFGSSGYK